MQHDSVLEYTRKTTNLTIQEPTAAYTRVLVGNISKQWEKVIYLYG